MAAEDEEKPKAEEPAENGDGANDSDDDDNDDVGAPAEGGDGGAAKKKKKKKSKCITLYLFRYGVILIFGLFGFVMYGEQEVLVPIIIVSHSISILILHLM